jgi:hypothetical protein
VILIAVLLGMAWFMIKMKYAAVIASRKSEHAEGVEDPHFY